jgi:hypothetical protein
MAGAPRTRVYLTVDVECAEERLHAGGVHPPLDYDLRVWGRLRNQAEELGVPLLLRELGRAGHQATFFLEVFGSPFFGEADFRELCRRLRDAAQDVQLHAHPIQRRPDWYTRREAPAPDDIGAYDVDRQTALLREALDRLERSGIDREGVLAFRAGNYGASNETWQAMRSVGLRLSSNYNLCYQHKNCRIRWPSPVNALFETDVEGVWELPISNFSEGAGRYRHVQLTAVSFLEMEHYLLEARRLGIPEVTIVTHSFEFFFVDSIAAKRGRPNQVNIERLRALLDFLRDHPDDFEVETVGALARRLSSDGWRDRRRDRDGAVPEGRPLLRWGRYLEQARKRLSSQGPLFS